MIKLCKQADEILFAAFDRLIGWQPRATGQILLGLCAAMFIINFLVM